MQYYYTLGLYRQFTRSRRANRTNRSLRKSLAGAYSKLDGERLSNARTLAHLPLDSSLN